VSATSASSATPERWARLIDERSPGLTWLASTLLEWSALLPAARRSWHVTAAASRGGAVQSLAAFHDELGILCVVSAPDVPAPFFGMPDAVRRLVGEPVAVDALVASVPELEPRIAQRTRRSVHVALGDGGGRDPAARRARDEEIEVVERLRRESGGDPDPMSPVDLAAAALRGNLWVLEENGVLLGTFRVDGASLRHVQVADAIVPPTLRGRGLGTRLVRAAAKVAREEYAGQAVVEVPEGGRARRALDGGGFLETGALDDVRFR
jgi:ribosomal protein S18 acetylase RimI-like enzyme